jgi:hypothetical protein
MQPLNVKVLSRKEVKIAKDVDNGKGLVKG